MVHECGIRLGEAVQQDMIAMRLTRPFKAILVASKAYVDAKGAPKTIGDLRELVKQGGAVDPLKDLAEAAREELRPFMVR